MVISSLGEDATLRYDMLAAFARWAAEGRLAVPIARTFALDEWGLARDISESGQARGKLVLLPGGLAAGDSPRSPIFAWARYRLQRHCSPRSHCKGQA
jgi:hypothetical protein